MQDADHPVNQTSGASSNEPSSQVIDIEPVSSSTCPPSAQGLVLLKIAPTIGSKTRLVAFCKEHSQLCLGLFLGVVASFTLGQLGTSPPMTIQRLSLNQSLFTRSNLWALDQFYQGTTPTLVKVPRPPLTPAPPQPSPQLKFVDRYYFADPTHGDGAAPSEPNWLMVDRFYFAEAPTQAVGAATAVVNRQAPQEVVAQLDSLAPIPWLPPEESFQSELTVPPPPDFNLSALTPTAALPDLGISSAAPMPSTQGQHTLLGVVQTNNFGAALIKTHDSSYSVRVGEAIRQSPYVLSELTSDKMILRHGQQTIVVNVGESF